MSQDDPAGMDARVPNTRMQLAAHLTLTCRAIPR
jgi:hypothetical protein